jgi:hypothetical protein
LNKGKVEAKLSCTSSNTASSSSGKNSTTTSIKRASQLNANEVHWVGNLSHNLRKDWRPI